MDSKQAAHMNSALNSIAKSLQSINRNLVSLVKQAQYPTTPKEYKWHPMDAGLWRIKRPERCPEDPTYPAEGNIPAHKQPDTEFPGLDKAVTTGFTYEDCCVRCEGTGQVPPVAGDIYVQRCPDCEGSGQSPTQQVRSDDPPTQEVIDDTVEALKNLKWWLRTSSKQTQHLQHLIEQLEKMKIQL